MNKTQTKSVSDSSKQSKASRQRKTRQESYRKKFNKPHMIIPQEDFAWALDQPNSVKTLFMECWMSDPYGSCWQVLNHNLSSGSFKRAKKILATEGLFMFRPHHSSIDGREVVCWMVINLHGSRRNDYWFNTVVADEDVEKSTETSDQTSHDLGDHERSRKDHERSQKDHGRSLEDHPRSSISSVSQSEQAIQNPSGGSQERLSNSPKELLETLRVDCEVSESDRDPAFEERVTSASLQEENVKAEEPDLGFVNKSNQNSPQANQSSEQDSGALNKKSTPKPLEQPYEFDWRNGNSVERSKAQILAIEEQRKSETYQNTWKEGVARIRAILEGKRKQRLEERRANLRGDSPMSFAERQALEEYKRELKANRLRVTQEDFWDDSGDF